MAISLDELKADARRSLRQVQALRYRTNQELGLPTTDADAEGYLAMLEADTRFMQKMNKIIRSGKAGRSGTIQLQSGRVIRYGVKEDAALEKRPGRR